MKKILSILMIAAVAMTAGLFSVKDAEAVPSFARQTQQPCFACHFQYFPKLNAMGRAFKLGAMTDTARDVIGDNLVLDISPFSMVFKSKFVKTDTDGYTGDETGDERGEWVIPDEMEAFFAGRVNDKWGAMVVIPFHDEKGGFAEAGKLLYSDEYNGIQYGGGVYFSGNGPWFAMELWNTGLHRPQRGWENRDTTVASQRARTVHDSTGFVLFAANELAFISGGPQIAHNRQISDDGLDVGSDWAFWYRAALTPSWNGWDFMLGIFGEAGTAQCDCDGDGTISSFKTKAIGIDGQAQGAYNDVSIEVVFNAILDTSDTLNAAPNTDTSNSHPDASGFGADVSLGFMEDVVGVKFGGLTYEDDNTSGSDNDTFINTGLWWNIYQDLKLSPEFIFQTDKDNGGQQDSKFILTLFTAW